MWNSTVKIFLIALLICCMGISSIYSGTYQKANNLWQQQMLWVFLGVIAFFAMASLNYRDLWDATYFLYGLAVFLLLLVYVLGVIRLGAQRWLKIGQFSFQPSEFAKIVMVIFLAKYFSRKSTYDVSLLTYRSGIWQSLILPLLFVCIPAGIIIEQPDLGSGVMVIFIFSAMLVLAGVKFRYSLTFFLLFILAIPLSWHFLHDYQRERLMVFLNPNIDPLGAGYTIIQSKIAIGSAGLLGKGWLSGTQSQLYFLPESHTDFIFATFTEERGILGAGLLLVLYYFLISYGIKIAGRTQDYFGRLLASGISLMLGIQVLVNISMVMGLAPVVGVPLPLMSYGGSSILVTFIALGILASIDRRRAVF